MKVTIVHFNPIESYPPVMNAIKAFSDAGLKVIVYTTEGNFGLTKFEYKDSIIHRVSKLNLKKSALIRLFYLLKFNIFTLFGLLLRKLKHILYYETHSVLPVFFYKKYFNRQVNIYIHYHEYMSLEEYLQPGMRMVNFAHKKEQYLYSKAAWISHTNQSRMDMFIRDNQLQSDSRFHIFPNYPPESWSSIDRKKQNGQLKCVFVGSLSVDKSYLKEFCAWIIATKGMATFDIYSYNMDKNTVTYLKELENPAIKVYPKGISYEKIPIQLSNYDVGIVLYKVFSDNVRYCEVNKFFEYLACGLDVWFPDEMEGMLHFVTKDTKPVIKAIDFTNEEIIEKPDQYLAKKSQYALKKYSYYMENITCDLINVIKSSDN